MSDYLYDLLALQNHSMEPYIFHISNYSKFPVCWNILISHILFIRTGTHISKSFFNIAFITKIENIHSFSVPQLLQSKAEICLDRRKNTE